MIHIGYGDSATGCLRAAIEEHDLPGDSAIPSRDDFTQGPLTGTDTGDFSHRKGYWQAVQDVLHFGMEVDQFYKESMALLDDIEDTEITVWQGDSAHDILATAWLVSYFADREVDWKIVDLAALSPDDLNEGLPPVNLAMFSPEQVVKLFKYRQNLGPNAIQMYKDLWQHMMSENTAYRIKDDNELLSVAEDYHDDMILTHLPTSLTPAPEAIGHVIGQSKHSLSDTTVEWRVRQLIKSGKVAYEGELQTIQDYEIMRVDE